MTTTDDHEHAEPPTSTRADAESAVETESAGEPGSGARLREGVAFGGVWLAGQTAAHSQRRGYAAGSSAHPAKMVPAIAARAISTYARPGGLVLDPMCGIGTTLVEARRSGHTGIGVEYEPRWADLARANLAAASAENPRGQTGASTGSSSDSGSSSAGAVEPPGWVLDGDARDLEALLPAELAGHVDLVITSPPYGPSAHGRLVNARGAAIRKADYQYGNPLDRGNLANVGHRRLLIGFTRILRAVTGFLRPGGHVVITARPWREHGELIDLPSQVLACGRAAGLAPIARHVALLGRITEAGGFIAHGSFFQRELVNRQRAAGLPLHLIAHEDVLVLRRPE